MADSPYFTRTYFDPSYFDTDPLPTGGTGSRRGRPEPVTYYDLAETDPVVLDDAEELFTAIV